MTTGPSYVVTCDEINYLIFRYLQESGYSHSAFTFGLEAQVGNSKIDGSQIPPGILLTFLQRGVNFLEIEDKEGNNVDMFLDSTAKTGSVSLIDIHRYMSNPGGFKHLWDKSEKPQEMDIDKSYDIEEENVLRLKGHTAKVLSISWNPHSSTLASVSSDSTTRVWQIPDKFPEKDARGGSLENTLVDCRVLKHTHPESSGEEKRNVEEVSTVAWNKAGTVLGTGTHKGGMRIWTPSGELRASLDLHKSPIFAFKWNPSGTYFLTGSEDRTVAIWKSFTGKCVKHYPFHQGAVMDADWKDDEVFASCSADRNVLMCSMKSNFPLLTFKGHQGEVNAVRFSPNRTLLGSAADDKTVRIWCAKSSRLVYELTGHHREVYVLNWCPHRDRGLTLATGSFDSTVKLWDMNQGICYSTFAEHSAAIYSVKYNKVGNLLASASSDGCLLIWSAKDGTVLKRFKSVGPIHDLDWNRSGDKVAAAFDHGSVMVFDIRKIFDTK